MKVKSGFMQKLAIKKEKEKKLSTKSLFDMILSLLKNKFI
jgi:hypothetical protein